MRNDILERDGDMFDNRRMEPLPMDPLLVPLMRDLLEWIGKSPRTYDEVMDGWRTSCPRLPVWEECTDRGLVTRRGRGIELTRQGRLFLAGRS